MNTLMLVATGCDHVWGRFDDLPGGEDPLRYRQCKKCGVIVGVMLGEQRERFHVRTLPCHKCGKPAVGRNWGRRRYAARCKWVCAEHMEPRPILDVLVDAGTCKTCGAELAAGERVCMKPIEDSKFRCYRVQCMVCFLKEQGPDR